MFFSLIVIILLKNNKVTVMSKYVVNLMEIVELDEGKDKTLYYNEELEIDNLDTFNVDEHYRNQSKKSNRIIIPLDIQEI